MSARKLVFLPSGADAPAHYLTIGATGEITASGVFGEGDDGDARTILVVPGTEVVARWIELPGSTMAQANAAARLLLGDAVASSAGGLHVAVAPARLRRADLIDGVRSTPGDDDGRRLVCVADRARIRAFLEQAKALGITPDHMVPDHLLLPAPVDGTILVAEWGDHRLLRGAHLAASIETGMADLLTRDKRTSTLTGDELEHAFSVASARLPVDLLQHEFALRADNASSGAWRRVGMLAAALLLSPLMLWGAEAARSTWEASRIEARTAALAQTLAPGEADPIASVEARMEALAGNRSLFHAAASLFEGVAALEDAKIENMAWLADQTVLSATLLHPSEEDIAALAVKLREAGLTLTEDGSTPMGGSFSTSIAVRPVP